MELLIRKMGNSAGLTLPPALMRDLDLSLGQAVLVERTGTDAITLRVKPKRKKYTAAELNKLCNLKAPMPSDLQAWEDMPPVGDEAL
jgi:antitoxin ChpS